MWYWLCGRAILCINIFTDLYGTASSRHHRPNCITIPPTCKRFAGPAAYNCGGPCAAAKPCPGWYMPCTIPPGWPGTVDGSDTKPWLCEWGDDSGCPACIIACGGCGGPTGEIGTEKKHTKETKHMKHTHTHIGGGRKYPIVCPSEHCTIPGHSPSMYKHTIPGHKIASRTLTCFRIHH